MSQATTTVNYELQEIQAPSRSTQGLYDVAHRVESLDVNGQSLPSYDGGEAAWKLLLTAFAFEALLWGSYEALPEPEV